MKRRVVFDFETRSCSDLRKEGAYKYSLDPTTQPTCLAVKFVGVPNQMFLTLKEVNSPWRKVPEGFRYHWQKCIEDDYEFTAHNAFFERCIYENILVKRYGWPVIPDVQYRCTAAKAASCALPRNLEGAGAAMNLSVQKDKRGYAAMMATCKPTRAWTAWLKSSDKIIRNTRPNHLAGIDKPPKIFLEPEDAPEVWNTLYEYCKIDVKAEEALDNALPDLSPEEQEIWHLNQELNWRGLRVDVPTIKKIVGIMDVESKKKLKELDSLTMGLVTKPNSVKSIMAFLEIEKVKLPNLRKQTVEDKLNDFDLSKDSHKLLELRKALSLTSTRKYQSFLARSNADERVRDIVLYHGASTGRDTGTGVQPHNFPRGLIKTDKSRPYSLVENVIECDHEMLSILYGDSLNLVFSAILRNMIIPTEGRELFVGDFAKIEVAVLWWLSNNIPGLKVLRSGKDPYIYMAAANTGRAYESFTDESPERQLGKAQTLGCGFGMGWTKFQKTAWDFYRLKLSDEQSQRAVQTYRTTNRAVPELWKQYETAAVTTVENNKYFTRAGKCSFEVKNQFLWVTLPSGRKLAYRDPQISWRESEYGPRKTLQFNAVNSKTKKWGPETTWGGTLTENIVQGVARDLIMQGVVRLEKAGYKVLLTVHDEAICEKKKGKGDLKEFIKILCEVPKWTDGCPIEAKGWVGERYRK